MSKQSEAKTLQGYEPKPTPSICSTCFHFRVDRIEERYHGRTWFKERNRRCAFGGFAVKKTATCDQWELHRGTP